MNELKLGRLGKVFLAFAAGWWQLAALAEEISDYKIAPLDILIVDVFNEKELTKELKVSANGEITVPFVGRVKVAGSTTFEVQDKLKELLENDYLVDPQVTVQVKEHAKRKINVTGEVNRPGQVDMPDETKMTILDAIAAAGGCSRLAKQGSVLLTRAGQEKPIEFDLKKLRKNPKLNREFALEPNDTIYVPQTKF